MALSVFECEICNEDFDSADHKPLFLLCGHTYCRFCVTRLPADDGGQKCPRCRQLLQQPVTQLPVNYSLMPFEDIPLLDVQHLSLGARCSVHEAILDHFCAMCGDIICRTCALQKHTRHWVVAMNDVINKTELVEDFSRELQGKIETSVEHLTNSLSVSSKVRNLIKQLLQFDEDVQQWEEKLLVGITSATQDLNAWKVASSKAIGEKQKIFEKLCRHWKETEPFKPDNLLLPNLRVKVEELNQSANLIEELVHESTAPSSVSCRASQELVCISAAQSNAGSPLRILRPSEHVLTIAGGSEVEDALQRVQLGLRPDKVAVVSPPNDPITELPACLDLLGHACSGDLEVKLLDQMWAPKATSGERLKDFIHKHGHKVSVFYGSAADAVAVACARGSSNLALGVRLQSMADVRHCANLSTSPRSVSCIRGLDVRAGGRIRQFGGQPWGWHFPDLQDGDVDWLSAIAALPMPLQRSHMQLYLYLPRCQLLEDDFRRLLKRCTGCIVYCEPFALSNKAQSKLADIALRRGVSLEWTIPPHQVF